MALHVKEIFMIITIWVLYSTDVFAFSPIHWKPLRNSEGSSSNVMHTNPKYTKNNSILREKISSEDIKVKLSFDLAKERTLSIITSNPYRSLAFSVWMVFCGAMLGPFLDSYHSAFGVLQYDTPIKVSEIGLTTAWWVPELFGLAGFIIGWLYILLDELLSSSSASTDNKNTPSPPMILVCISFFTLQYWLSGVLYQASFDRGTILMIMSILSAIGYISFDASISGLLASLATAVGGPLIEIGLIWTLSGSGTGYHYTDAGETGFFPLWISPIYFLGGPAVGNLARGIWGELSQSDKNIATSDERDDSPDDPTLKQPNCKECNDTRAVGCPNCDALGFYTSYNRRVKCNCCKGKGLVICRACFSNYDSDPYDIDAIRNILSRIPD